MRSTFQSGSWTRPFVALPMLALAAWVLCAVAFLDASPFASSGFACDFASALSFGFDFVSAAAATARYESAAVAAKVATPPLAQSMGLCFEVAHDLFQQQVFHFESLTDATLCSAEQTHHRQSCHGHWEMLLH
eukprot:CAMPEP_0172690244 /NCGR_PEP_ID=MMETSP1074-20121228/23718_1 /TAXON_ID=2916 /ORGANISM="Ceratium fusus, Strain PA161109" /LENGTH=132 /DNA_ID=CAMNT_0013510163 /DNA_START=331 /DNA_END=729 /DNA_ORIENTATION=+